MTDRVAVGYRIDEGHFTVTACIPPRRNGQPNKAAFDNVMRLLATVNPEAFDPVTAAEIAMQDGITADGAGIVLDELMTPEKAAAAQRFLSECATGGCE